MQTARQAFWEPAKVSSVSNSKISRQEAFEVHRTAMQLGFPWLMILMWLGGTNGETQVIAAAPGSGASSAQCQAQGLSGQCK